MNTQTPAPFLPLPPQGSNLKIVAQHARNQHIQLRTWANKVNAQINQTVGPVLASSVSITISALIHHVTGTAPIKTFVPNPQSTGAIFLIADGAWQTITGGNIKEATIVTPGRAYQWVFDGTLWYLVM